MEREDGEEEDFVPVVIAQCAFCGLHCMEFWFVKEVWA